MKKNYTLIGIASAFGLTAIAAIVAPVLVSNSVNQANYDRKQMIVASATLKTAFYDFKSEKLDRLGKDIEAAQIVINDVSMEDKLKWIEVRNANNLIINDAIESIDSVLVKENPVVPYGMKIHFKITWKSDYVLSAEFANSVEFIYQVASYEPYMKDNAEVLISRINGIGNINNETELQNVINANIKGLEDAIGDVHAINIVNEGVIVTRNADPKKGFDLEIPFKPDPNFIVETPSPLVFKEFRVNVRVSMKSSQEIEEELNKIPKIIEASRSERAFIELLKENMETFDSIINFSNAVDVVDVLPPHPELTKQAFVLALEEKNGFKNTNPDSNRLTVTGFRVRVPVGIDDDATVKAELDKIEAFKTATTVDDFYPGDANIIAFSVYKAILNDYYDAGTFALSSPGGDFLYRVKEKEARGWPIEIRLLPFAGYAFGDGQVEPQVFTYYYNNDN